MVDVTTPQDIVTGTVVVGTLIIFGASRTWAKLAAGLRGSASTGEMGGAVDFDNRILASDETQISEPRRIGHRRLSEPSIRIQASQSEAGRHTSVHVEHMPVDEARRVRGQKDSRADQLLHIAPTAKWRPR
jgi:hypothetical protein